MMLHRKSQSSHLLKLLALIPIVSVALALNAETVTDVVYDTPQKQVPVKKGKKSTTIKAGPGKDIQIIETESTDGEDQQAYDVETFPIKGKVYDVDDRSPIVGAVVKIVGSTKGTVTDREGNFRLEVSVGNRIEVLYAGYDTYTIGVSKAYAKDNNYMVGLNKEGTYQDKGRVFDVVENMPQFPGGPQALFEFISKNIRYPEEAEAVGIQGRVLVSFVVEKDGSISEPNIVKQIDPSLDAEALRVVNSMPDWEPGTQNGEPIRVKYTIP
ncbi:MAG: TonB family protein, partial [Prevotella sp.]|nr:TonB family protein [Prevotella sp.]